MAREGQIMTDERKAATGSQKAALTQVMKAVMETVMEMGDDGAPGGIMYTVLNGQGMSLVTFNRLMEGLVNSGALTVSGHLYRITELGKDYVNAMNRIGSREAN